MLDIKNNVFFIYSPFSRVEDGKFLFPSLDCILLCNERICKSFILCVLEELQETFCEYNTEGRR